MAEVQKTERDFANLFVIWLRTAVISPGILLFTDKYANSNITDGDESIAYLYILLLGMGFSLPGFLFLVIYKRLLPATDRIEKKFIKLYLAANGVTLLSFGLLFGSLSYYGWLSLFNSSEQIVLVTSFCMGISLSVLISEFNYFIAVDYFTTCFVVNTSSPINKETR